MKPPRPAALASGGGRRYDGFRAMLLVIKLFSTWQVQLVSALLILFLPLVSYLAAVTPRGGRRRDFVPPADKATDRADK